MTTGAIPSISGDTGLTYLAEGAANIVYRLEIRHPTPPPSQLEDYGEGTPPPTEIESDFDEKCDGFEYLGVFESTLFRIYVLHPSDTELLPLFSPVLVTLQGSILTSL
jgi:inositol-pentakisphosphate 2-kinase